MYYLIAYLVTNLAAFGIVTVVGRATGSDEISAYAGLSRRSPALALALLVALLSLGGIPPFAGFFGKLLVFGAAVQQGIASENPFEYQYLAGGRWNHQLDPRACTTTWWC